MSRMRLVLFTCAIALSMLSGSAWAAGTAPGGPGETAVWTPANKTGFGTSTTGTRTPPPGLEEDIARTRTEFTRQRLTLWVRAALGLDTCRARDRLRLSIDRLACLHYRRQPAPQA